VLVRVEQGLLEESMLKGWLEEGFKEDEDREWFGLPRRSGFE
jgi:hypothetical protein